MPTFSGQAEEENCFEGCFSIIYGQMILRRQSVCCRPRLCLDAGKSEIEGGAFTCGVKSIKASLLARHYNGSSFLKHHCVEIQHQKEGAIYGKEAEVKTRQLRIRSIFQLLCCSWDTSFS